MKKDEAESNKKRKDMEKKAKKKDNAGKVIKRPQAHQMESAQQKLSKAIVFGDCWCWMLV